LIYTSPNPALDHTFTNPCKYNIHSWPAS